MDEIWTYTIDLILYHYCVSVLINDFDNYTMVTDSQEMYFDIYKGKCIMSQFLYIWDSPIFTHITELKQYSVLSSTHLLTQS